MRPSIYLVDDDERLLHLTKRCLEPEGFDVFTFNSPRELLASLDDPVLPSPDALVFDLNMAEMGGRELYRRVRRLGVTSPVLILAEFGAHFARGQLGAEAAFAKPYDLAELVAAIRAILKDRAAYRGSRSYQ